MDPAGGSAPRPLLCLPLPNPKYATLLLEIYRVSYCVTQKARRPNSFPNFRKVGRSAASTERAKAKSRLFQLQEGLAPYSLARGSVSTPGPRWGLCTQTPVMPAFAKS